MRLLVSFMASLTRLRAIRSNGTRGQVLPLYALAGVALFALGGLAMSVGYWRYQQRLEQSAADSAAVAGAIELLYSAANVATFAQNDAASNGYTNGAAGTTVTVNTPPTTGPYAGNAHAVEVILTRNQPVYFAGVIPGLFTNGVQPVRVRAVARNNAPGAGSGCVTALVNLTINGGAGGFLVPNCGVIAQAMTINGNGTVTAQYIGVATGAVPGCGGCTQALPTRSISPVDPCVTITSCDYLLVNGPGNPGAAPAPTLVNGVTTYHPGEYAATLKPGTATLAPGVYILDNGMTASGNNVITATGGVTIYNKGGAIKFTGSSYINLVPPTTGLGAGIALFQPASNTSAVTISGGGTYGLSGMIYMPSATLTLNGSDPAVSDLVVGTMTVNGGGITVNAVGTGNPNNVLGVGHAVLAE